jgi:hypothetical protein
MKSPSVPHLKVVDASKPFAAHAVRIRQPCKDHEFRVFRRRDPNSIERTKALKWALLSALIVALACAASWYIQAGPARPWKPRTEKNEVHAGALAKSSGQQASNGRAVSGKTSVERNSDEARQQGVNAFIIRERLEAQCPRIQFGSKQGPMSFSRYELDVAAKPRPGELDDFTIRAMMPAKDLTSLYAGVDRELNQNVLLFIHGFNVGHEGAIRKAAQFVHELDYPGIVFVFSWPSQCRFDEDAYLADQKMISGCVAAFCKCLQMLSDRFTAAKIQIVAHSLACRLVSQTAVEMGKDDKLKDIRFANIIFASPDMDAERFSKQFAKPLLHLAQRVTVYYSRCDPMLRMAEVLNEGRERLGRIGLDAKSRTGVELIDFTAMGCSCSTHSYFRKHPVLVKDIHGVLAGVIPYSHRKLLAQSVKQKCIAK